MNVETSRERVNQVRVLLDRPTLHAVITHLVTNGDADLWARAIDSADKVEAGDRTCEDSDGNLLDPLDVLVSDVDALVDAYHPLPVDLSAEQANELSAALCMVAVGVKAAS